ITNADGIDVLTAASVHIEHCEIERFDSGGVYFAAAGGDLFLNDSMVRDNGGAGLSVYDATRTGLDPGSMRVTIDNSRFEHNWGGDGLLLGGGTVTVTRSVLSGNAGSGIASGFSAVHVTDTVANGNGNAGYYLQSSTTIVESSVAQGNQYG